MKWMIASDLHGSYFYASQMQQAFEREQADRLLLLGDSTTAPATTCRRAMRPSRSCPCSTV